MNYETDELPKISIEVLDDWLSIIQESTVEKAIEYLKSLNSPDSILDFENDDNDELVARVSYLRMETEEETIERFIYWMNKNIKDSENFNRKYGLKRESKRITDMRKDREVLIQRLEKLKIKSK
jgi:hypothetical protein